MTDQLLSIAIATAGVVLALDILVILAAATLWAVDELAERFLKREGKQ